MKTAYELSKEIIQTVKPACSYGGSDYEAWKVSARTKLSSLLGIDRFTKVAP